MVQRSQPRGIYDTRLAAANAQVLAMEAFRNAKRVLSAELTTCQPARMLTAAVRPHYASGVPQGIAPLALVGLAFASVGIEHLAPTRPRTSPRPPVR